MCHLKCRNLSETGDLFFGLPTNFFIIPKVNGTYQCLDPHDQVTEPNGP